MYDYEIRKIKYVELEKTLETYTGAKWELVSVTCTSPGDTGPVTGEFVLVIVRRPKG